MNSATEHFTAMGADTVSTDGGGVLEKPKPRLFTAVLPSIWFIKLRSRRRRSKAADANHVELVITDNAPFLPKTIQNCYKNAELVVNECAHQPLDATTPSRKSIESVTPSRKSIESVATPSRKSVTTTTRSTPLTSIATTTTSSTTTSSTTTSVFSRCMYRSTFFSGLRSLCKLVDDDSSKGRKAAAPNMRAWFLVGCGGTPRPRTRHSSLDLEKEPGLIEMEGLDPIEESPSGVEASWPTKAESWSGTNSAPWNDEVVKNQVEVKKKKYAGSKPTLGHLFSTRSDTDSPLKTFQETEEESEIHIEDPKLVSLPWRSMSFGSDSTFRVPSDDEDDGNISDSQSLLLQKDEDAVKLLASLDHALDRQNLKRFIEDDEDSDHAGGFSSPRFELHNSPVFESFLESSAKAWGIDFPSLKIDEAKNSGSISDKSREVHCVTVQTMEKTRRKLAPPAAAAATTKQARKAKRSHGPSPPARKTPPLKRDQRTNHPQREESMVDPDLHDDFNHARRKFNEQRKRSKQRRSKQVASVPDNTSPSPPPAPKPSCVKERVAVVVESSYDPYNDFRESMIEMIVDQDIQETGDLEELLQCYLSLNEAEYHNVIVDVFTDVWHELFENKF